MQMIFDSHAPHEASVGLDPAGGYANYLDPTSLVLRAIAGLCSEGVPPEKVPYFTDHVSPLLTQITEYLMQEMPQNPIGALILWLLSGSNPPPELWTQVHALVNGCATVGFAEDDPRSEVAVLYAEEEAVECPATVPKIKSALKDAKGITTGSSRRGTAYVTPSGMLVSEERLRRVAPLLDEQKHAIVDSQPLFQPLASDDKDSIVQALELQKHLDGEEVMKHGERADGMYIVVRGEGKIMVSHEIGTVKAGDIFGDQEMIHGIPAHQTVEACGGHGLTTLKLPALVFKMMGLKRKVGLLTKRKAAKVRDETVPEVDVHHHAAEVGPVEYASCEEDIVMIRDVIFRNENLQEVLNFSSEQVGDICRLARKKYFQAGETVFRKGEYGSTFYVIHDGVFRLTQGNLTNVTEAPAKDDKGARLRAGASFGELSVMYNAPRSATVQCVKPGSCWMLSRAIFKDSMKTKMDGRINEYAELLRTVDMFSKMSLRQMASLCNTVEERYFFESEDIVRQGEVADSFYIIFEGSCVVVKDGLETVTLQTGNFFGEKALIEHDVRAATVRVTSDKCTVLALERLAFEVLLMKQSQVLGADSCEVPVAPPIADEQHELLSTLKTKLQNDGLQPCRRYVSKESLQHCGVLGRGAFGYVSLERDAETGELYALKAMSKGHIVQEKLKAAVCNEKSCMELLSSDFVVSLVNTFTDEANVYLLLVPCFGGELFDVYTDHPSFFGSEQHCQFYSACVAMGLDHMHSRKIIYRDLKLENCLLTLTGYLKLTDLGIAKVCVGKTYTVCGTADYFAPETLRQTGHNRAVDWWAMGVMMFVMISGRSPFDAPDQMKIYRKIMKGFGKVSFPEECPELLSNCIRALCQKNPEERLTMGSLGVQNLKDHPWYRTFSWKNLDLQRMSAPYVPSKTEEQILAKAAANTVEALPAIPYEDDGSGWEEVFARGT